MRMRPLFSRLAALILEHGNVFEPRVPFQVRDAQRVGFQHPLDFFVAHLGQLPGMLRSLHNNFVGAGGSHAVVDSLGFTPWFAFDSIERTKVRIYADLPRSMRRQIQNRAGLRAVFRTKWAGIRANFLALRVACYDPASSDGIFT